LVTTHWSSGAVPKRSMLTVEPSLWSPLINSCGDSSADARPAAAAIACNSLNARSRNDLSMDSEKVTLKRALGPLTFDLGICLVLITLPSLAVFVAIQVATRRRQFHPPFTTWFAAMLFAIVPLRNILPGAPPPGAWIDQALVLWVLIALVASMVIYIVAWYRQCE